MSTQEETIVWHKYPDDPPTKRYSYALYLVHSISTGDEGFTYVVGYGNDKFWWDNYPKEMEHEFDGVIAWAELPKGWRTNEPK